jgi:N-acetylglucosamine-6-sulfatase
MITVTLRRLALPALGLAALLGGLLSSRAPAAPPALTTAQAGVPTLQAVPRNVVLILSDDHPYDLMGFMERAPEWLETPNLDRMRAQGAHVRNAFVTTALCSPSRASILTGRYAHRHGVVDNTSPIPSGTVFFPKQLQRVGYRTPLAGDGRAVGAAHAWG